MKEIIDSYTIGKRIKLAREKAKLTQYDLHKLTGISITQISAYENGNRNIGLVSLNKIANATNSTIDELYNGKIEDKPTIKTINEGKLIVNCITTLFEKGVITSLPKEYDNNFVDNGLGYYYQIGFYYYVDILDDFINKLVDFENNKDNYPNPIDFKNQLIEASAKKN